MTSGQIVGKMNTQTQLNVPLEISRWGRTEGVKEKVTFSASTSSPVGCPSARPYPRGFPALSLWLRSHVCGCFLWAAAAAAAAARGLGRRLRGESCWLANWQSALPTPMEDWPRCGGTLGGSFLSAFCLKLRNALRDFSALPDICGNHHKIARRVFGEETTNMWVGAKIGQALACSLPRFSTSSFCGNPDYRPNGNLQTSGKMDPKNIPRVSQWAKEGARGHLPPRVRRRKIT